MSNGRDFGTWGDVHARIDDHHVATVEIRRPPENYFDAALIANLCDAFEAVDAEPAGRAIVLASEGRHFCAGANFGSQKTSTEAATGRHLYDEAVRLFETRTPVVAAIQGAAIGGVLGSRRRPIDSRISRRQILCAKSSRELQDISTGRASATRSQGGGLLARRGYQPTGCRTRADLPTND